MYLFIDEPLPKSDQTLTSRHLSPLPPPHSNPHVGIPPDPIPPTQPLFSSPTPSLFFSAAQNCSCSNRGPCSLPPPRRLCARARRRPVDRRRPGQASRAPFLLPYLYSILSPLPLLVTGNHRRHGSHHRPEPLELCRRRPPRPHHPDPLGAAPFRRSSRSLHLPAPLLPQFHRVVLGFHFNEQQERRSSSLTCSRAWTPMPWSTFGCQGPARSRSDRPLPSRHCLQPSSLPEFAPPLLCFCFCFLSSRAARPLLPVVLTTNARASGPNPCLQSRPSSRTAGPLSTSPAPLASSQPALLGLLHRPAHEAW